MPIEIFFDAPDYAEWCTDAQLREKYDIKFEESGWYILKNGDHILVIERNGKYKVWVWVDLDPRDEMEKLMDLPSFRTD